MESGSAETNSLERREGTEIHFKVSFSTLHAWDQ